VGRKISLSNLLQGVRISKEKFKVGPSRDQPQVRYVPESDYNDLLERCRQEKDEAYRKGRSDGLQEGLARGEEKSNAICRQFNGLILDTQSRRAEVFRKAELEVVELALAIAHRVIAVQADMTPEIIVDSVRKAVKLLLEKSSLVVKVSPQQEAFVRENLDKLYEIDDGIQRIEIESDRRVNPGGCVVETESGNVDARIETQLENIADALRKANQDSQKN
jgi:flagellar assembly protein FliH